MCMSRVTAIVYALLAAMFYALNVPVSKLLLGDVPPKMMAGFLYLGAGIGIGLMSLVRGNRETSEKLDANDVPFVIGMVVLDIFAPILLMYGLLDASASTASLLNNFEIVATTVIALAIFHEHVSMLLWGGIGLITLASILLSWESGGSFSFSWGALLVLGATLCWGMENNCTRMISSKNTYDIVVIKGLGSGTGSLILALVTGEKLPGLSSVLGVLLLGYVAYGLSIFTYIRAQSVIGAAKTSAYYAVAPFIGALLGWIFFHDAFSFHDVLALIIMIIGSVIVVIDTLHMSHDHTHTHTITHTHDGSTHTHVITHSHPHSHLGSGKHHHHTHHDLNPHTHVS